MTNNTHIGYLVFRSDYSTKQLPFESIMYLEDRRTYVIIHTPREKVISNTSYRALLNMLPQRLFIESSRRYTVAISQIKSLEPRRITLITNDEVRFTKGYRKHVIDTLMQLGAIEKGFS